MQVGAIERILETKTNFLVTTIITRELLPTFVDLTFIIARPLRSGPPLRCIRFSSAKFYRIIELCLQKLGKSVILRRQKFHGQAKEGAIAQPPP
jgi:hypothetical protein